MTYSLTGMTTLGEVTSEESNKDAQLFQQPMPASDSSSAIILDLFGVQRTITIKGIFVDGTSGLTVAQFIGELDALVAGNQSKSTFASDKSASPYGVYIQSVSWSSEPGAIAKVDYNISMIQGA